MYKQIYQSPIGDLSLVANDDELLGCWFVGQRYFEKGIHQPLILEENAVLAAAKKWLDNYFSGYFDLSLPKLAHHGTPFQQAVWSELDKLSAGNIITYGELADRISSKSAQAVGGAVGRNPHLIFRPCHRVVGSKGQLTGYSAGLDKKIWLLKHEGLALD